MMSDLAKRQGLTGTPVPIFIIYLSQRPNGFRFPRPRYLYPVRVKIVFWRSSHARQNTASADLSTTSAGRPDGPRWLAFAPGRYFVWAVYLYRPPIQINHPWMLLRWSINSVLKVSESATKLLALTLPRGLNSVLGLSYWRLGFAMECKYCLGIAAFLFFFISVRLRALWRTWAIFGGCFGASARSWGALTLTRRLALRAGNRGGRWAHF